MKSTAALPLPTNVRVLDLITPLKERDDNFREYYKKASDSTPLNTLGEAFLRVKTTPAKP
jgi:hypothetical protein